MASRAQAFRDWATRESVTTSGSIDQLKDKRLTIDAEDFLETILTSQVSREPLLPALGGLPFALRKHVDTYISNFKEANITPTFVFNGLDLACKDRATIARDSKLAARSLDEAWSLYSQSRADEAVAEFGKSCTYRIYHILRWLQSYLARQGVRVQTAPYTAAAQVVSLDQQNFGDAIVGSMSCLMFGASVVVVSFDWESQSFTWVDRAKCFAKLGMNEDQFIDFSLISGLTILAPPAELESAPNYIQGAREIVGRSGTIGFAAYDSLSKEFRELFKKARTAVKYNVILTGSGEITLTRNDSAASDMHDVIGQRLPDEIYYYMSRGLVGPRVLNWRTRAEVFEIPPLDGGSSSAYQQLVTQKLAPLRTRTMALINTMLHRYYQKKDVELVSWFNENNKQSLNVPDASAPTDAANRWRVKSSTFDKASELGSGVRKSPLLFAVGLLSEESSAKETITEKKNDVATQELREPQELIGNTVLRFLEDRGYINNNHTLSAWGKALKAAFDHAQKSGYIAKAGAKEVEEAIFMAFELHKLDVLSTSQMFPSDKYLGAPMRGTETDKAYTLLISRVACLGTFHHKEIGFTGPLSRHLLGYHQMTSVVRGSLRDLVEVHALSMAASGVVSRHLSPTDYTTLGAELPFVEEPDLGLSLVVKSFLDELSNEPGKRSDISRWFNHAYDISGDLEKAWNMWGAINAGIQAADSAIVNNDTKTTFKNADEWLAQKLQQADSASNNGKA